jgi:hypothetical protein
MSDQQVILDAQEKLLRAQNMYNNIYVSMRSTTDDLTQSKLAIKVAAMQMELARMKNTTEVHDREYMDLAQSGQKPNIWQRNGLATVQDWVLFLFFTVYGLFVLGLIIAVAMSGTKIIMGIVGVLLGSFVFGIMISTIIMRYG